MIRHDTTTRTDARRLPALLLAALLAGACGDRAGEDHGARGQGGHAHGDEDDEHAHEEHGAGGEHADEEGRVVLTPEQLAAAGVELAVAGPGRLTEALTLPGSIAPNADAVLHVTPRVPGQVREVHRNLGARVEPGDLLCVVDSVQLGEAAAAYLRTGALARAAEETLERERALYEQRIESLTATLDGAIELQRRIRDREQELRQQAVSTLRPLLEAERDLQAAVLDRERQLTDLRAGRDARLLALDVDLRAVRIDLTAAANRLRALGVPPERLEGLAADDPLLSGRYDVVAAGSGVVVDRHVSPGEYVEAGSKLFVIEDLSRVWFVASVFEDHLQSVRTGQRVRVFLDAFPGRVIDGTLAFVDYHVDPTSRSLGARVELDNAQLEGWSEELPLRPGMFGRAELETTSLEVEVLLPEAALVHDDRGDHVYVQVEPLTFERREVVARHGAGGLVEVVEGLRPGERVAVKGTFLLESAQRRGELGGGHSH